MRLDFPGVEGNIDIYMMVLRAICGETKDKSMIDLMCAFAPNTPKLGFSHRIYVDIIDRVLDHPEEQHRFLKMDVLKVRHSEMYDVAICSDGIEHLHKDDGFMLLKVMQTLSKKQIIFTPLTDLFGMAESNNHDPEAHRSLWTPDDLPGWATIVFPDYHRVWNGGAFFAFNCENLEEEFERVKNSIIL